MNLKKNRESLYLMTINCEIEQYLKNYGGITMAKKEELIQIRCSTKEKELAKNEAETRNLTLSQYGLNCILKNDKNTSKSIENLTNKIDDIKEQNDNHFYYLKEDLEAIKNSKKEEVKREYISINLQDKTELSLYKIDDILEANNSLYIVENIFENALGIKNILNLKTSKLTAEHAHAIVSVRRKVEV